MRPEPTQNYCENPNIFSSSLAPAIEEALPPSGSIAARALDHVTGIRPFLNTVSEELCSSNRMGTASRDRTLGFLARSTTSAAIIGGTATLVGIGLVAGSPILAVGAGVVGLAVLPPLAEKAARGAVSFAEGVLGRIRAWRWGE